MAGVRYFDEERIDHRQVERGRHAVVEVVRVLHAAFGAHEVLLGQSHADALGDAALNLPFDVRGVDGSADVLNRRVAKDCHLARVAVDLDVDDVAGEGRSRRRVVDVYADVDGAAGARQASGYFFESHAARLAIGVVWSVQDTIIAVGNVGGVALPDL